MQIRQFLAGMFSIGLLVLGAQGVCGQPYPNKPIRIVTSEPGGANDFAARLMAPGFSSNLGQPVIVDNRAGILPMPTVAKALPNGYTLLLHTNAVWTAPLIQTMPWDPARDFSPIVLTHGAPNILVVHPSVAVKSVSELIALAKAKPGGLNYASSGTGGSPHLAAELFKSMAGVDMVRIAYKSAGPALNGLVAGQVQLMFPSAGAAAPHVKSGRLRPLAVTSLEPSALVSGLPTVSASGVPGYESKSIYGIFAPAKTPAAIIGRLNQELVRVINLADVRERFLNAGVEPVGSSPEEFAAAIRSEVVRMSKVIKDAGIQPD